MRLKRQSKALLAALAGAIFCCQPTLAAGPVVVATIAQIGEPVARIAGGCAEVTSLLGEGVDPHLYQPTRADMKRLLDADLVLANGHNLEAGLRRALDALAERDRVLYVAESVDRSLLLPWSDNHSDPHLWMDPALWQKALAAAVDRMIALVPECEGAARQRAAAYFETLEALDAYGLTVIASIPEQSKLLVTAHDAFAYFGRRYTLELEGVQGISTESEAGLARMEALVKLLVERQIPAVFVESSVSDRLVKALIEGAAARGHTVRIGGTLFSDAMGAPGTYRGTLAGMLDHNITTITQALGGHAAGFSPQLAEGQ